MVNTVFFSDQYMSKDLLAVISILNNCSIYKLLTVILTHAQTHTRKDMSYPYLCCILNAVKAMTFESPWSEKAKPLSSHRPTHLQLFPTSLLLPLTRNSLPDVHRVNVISVDNLLILSCFKKAQANTTLPVSVVLISDSSFKCRKFCPKTGTPNPRVIWSSHLLLRGQVCRWHGFILTTCRRTSAPPIGSNES